MTEYFTPIDVANRALQHCGASRINPALGFTENSKNASEISFCYGKLRRAELRRNVWRFATRRTVIRAIDATTMMVTPALWSPQSTYYAGSIVVDSLSNIWISTAPNNLGNDPQNTTMWQPYFGPLTVSQWAASNGYFAGELVYTAPGNGTNRVYLSLQNGNSDNPATPTDWSATSAYFKNQVVTFNSVAYMSLIDLNTNNQPNNAPALWSAGTSYSIGNLVGGSDGIIYSSVVNANTGHDPTTSGGSFWTNTGVLNPWTTVFVGGSGSDKWLQIGGAEFPAGVTLAPINLNYPLSAQSSPQADYRNVYRLPSGFLRQAPQNPNQVPTWLGGPSGFTYSDWTLEGDFLTSCEVGPISFRFVADVTDVRAMDDMFCEGFAARIALEVCEPITQSTTKIGTIAKVYDEWINQARTVNGIETGADEPPEDEYVSVRA